MHHRTGNIGPYIFVQKRGWQIETQVIIRMLNPEIFLKFSVLNLKSLLVISFM